MSCIYGRLFESQILQFGKIYCKVYYSNNFRLNLWAIFSNTSNIDKKKVFRIRTLNLNKVFFCRRKLKLRQTMFTTIYISPNRCPKYWWPENSLRKVPPRLFPPEICRWREPVPIGVLNPNATEASYKPKQRSYRKTKPKIYNFNFFFSTFFKKFPKKFIFIFEIYMKDQQSVE